MRDRNQELVSRAVCRLAADLPLSTLHIVARIIEDSSGWSMAKRRMVELPQPHHRNLAVKFVEECESADLPVAPQMIAFALTTAGVGERVHRDSQNVELVWTGPDIGAVPFRRTEQAILEVLDSAQERITLVSYAVYSIPHISMALVRAAKRNVQINVVVETPHKNAGKDEYDTLQALGKDVARCCSVFYWPHEKRQKAGSKVGILHVKSAVADGRRLFLSSANLTEYAFSINMELGVLVTGGGLPDQVQANFDRLIDSNVLERV